MSFGSSWGWARAHLQFYFSNSLISNLLSHKEPFPLLKQWRRSHFCREKRTKVASSFSGSLDIREVVNNGVMCLKQTKQQVCVAAVVSPVQSAAEGMGRCWVRSEIVQQFSPHVSGVCSASHTSLEESLGMHCHRRKDRWTEEEVLEQSLGAELCWEGPVWRLSCSGSGLLNWGACSLHQQLQHFSLKSQSTWSKYIWALCCCSEYPQSASQWLVIAVHFGKQQHYHTSMQTSTFWQILKDTEWRRKKKAGQEGSLVSVLVHYLPSEDTVSPLTKIFQAFS